MEKSKLQDLELGNYILKEKSKKNGYYLAEDTKIEIKWNETTETYVENELEKGKIKVIKIDKDDNSIAIPDTKFEILDQDKKYIETIVTDENGIAESSNLPSYNRIYYVHEIEANEAYQLNDTEFEVGLTVDKTTELTIENEVKKGKIQIEKVDKDNENIKIEGVKFNIINERTNEIVDIITTNAEGIAITKPLNIFDTYTAYEIETNIKYELNTENVENIKVPDNDTITVQITNERKKGQVRIIKVDKDDNEVLLENVKFEILDSNMNVIEELTTNAKGEAISSMLPCIDETYYIREKETLETYVLNEEIKTITLEENQIKDLVFENEKIKGYLEITKVDAKDNNIKLENAEFGIYNENNELVQTLKTDENGIATSKLLKFGKYYIKELSTSSVYYFLNEETFEFEIVKNDETISVQVENEPVEIEVNVDKEGDIETKPGNIVNYTFSNIANESNTYLDSFKWYDYIPTDSTRIEKMTTGTWNQDLEYNIYYKTNKSDDYVLYKENLSTKENYKLDFTTIEFTEDEYITEFYFDFGKVDIGFREETAPTLQCRALDTLEDNSTFTNHTKTVGNFYEIETESDSKWTTIVHTPEEPEPVLPRTGK